MNRIAVTGPKGGIGKTFIACNLAFYMHQSRMQVCPGVVDLGAECPASRYLGGSAYAEHRHVRENDFVFQTDLGMIVASCQDWDKAGDGARYEAFKEIMTDPRRGSPVVQRNLQSHEQLMNCDRFIYDTDHHIKTFIRFLTGFEKVVILVDDHISMENLAYAWGTYSRFENGQLTKRRPRRTYILANRAKKASTAKKALLQTCKRIFPLDLSEKETERCLVEISEFFIEDFAIPKVRESAVRKSFGESQPIWDYVPEAKDHFRQLANVVR